MSGPFSGIDKAELFERGRYFPHDFKGVVEIKRTLLKRTRSVGDAFIVETRVLEVQNEGHPDSKWSPVKVGEKRSWFQKMQDPSVALPAIKEWAAAVAGYYAHEKDAIEEEVEPELEDTLEKAVEDETGNDFIGISLGLTTFHTETKNKRDFTVHEWSPVDEPEEEPDDAVDEMTG